MLDTIRPDQLILDGKVQSPQQVDFYTELETGTSSIILEAVAGSGKTTTIVNGARSFVPKHCLTTFLAFNKKIAEELSRRLPPSCTATTFHSSCLSALSRSLPKRPRIEAKKTFLLLKENLKYRDLDLYGSFANRLIGYAKNAGVGIESLLPNTFESFESLVAHFSLSLESRDADPSRGIEIAMNCFDDSVADLSVIDFDDMLYLALLRKVRFDISNFIFVDEAQDTNGVQRELLKLMGRFGSLCPRCQGNGDLVQIENKDELCPTCNATGMLPGVSRLIAVGDPMQAIYGFRGADANALNHLRLDFNAKTMPLSTCYRCSQAVIAEVWRNFPQLKPV